MNRRRERHYRPEMGPQRSGSRRSPIDQAAPVPDYAEQMRRLREVPHKPADDWERIHDAVLDRLDREGEPDWIYRTRERIADFWEAAVCVTLGKRSWGPALGLAALCMAVTGLLVVSLRQEGEPVATGDASTTSALEQVTASMVMAEGSVTLRDADSARESPAGFDGLPGKIRAGTVVRTHADGRAIMRFEDGSSVALLDEAEVVLGVLSRSTVELQLKAGTICAQVRKSTVRKSFVVSSNSGACRVLGTRFMVSVLRKPDGRPRRTVFSVLQGSVEVSPQAQAGQPLRLADGDRVEVRGATPGPLEVISDLERAAASFDILDNGIASAERADRGGTLRITSQPSGALILIDGRELGRTPVVAAVAAGDYTMTVSKSGHLDWIDSVVVGEGRDVHLSVFLKERQPSPIGSERMSAAVDLLQETPPPSPKREDRVGEELLATGHRLLKQGNLVDAVEVFELLIYRDSTDEELRATALVKAFQASQRQGKYRQAVRYADRALESEATGSSRELVLFDRASLKATYLADPEGAIDDFASYAAQYPEGVLAREALRKLAALVIQHPRQSRGMRLFRKSIDRLARDPKSSPRTLLLLGMCCEEDFSRCELASTCYDRVVQTAPESSQAESALFRYAGCLRKTGSVEQAARAYELYRVRYPRGKWAAEADQRAGSGR